MTAFRQKQEKMPAAAKRRKDPAIRRDDRAFPSKEKDK